MQQNTTGAFVPPHCPNRNCHYHNPLQTGWQFKKSGFFHRLCKPRRIQRFTCKHCGRWFSSQTFSTTYWLKRPDILPQLFTKLTACMALRQIAHDLNVHNETISRQTARLGRHCLLFHALMMQHAKPVTRIVLDGFVTFEWSQYFPFHHHLVVEKGTDFIPYTTDSEVRRSGTMTDVQRNRRKELEDLYGRPDPQAVAKDVLELLTVVTGGQPRATIYSDDHRTYRNVIRGLPCEIDHQVTPSTAKRDKRNPLWEVNLADLLLRHCSANHKRETIAWSKRRQGSAYRLAVFIVWRNYIKVRREKVRGSPTPAMSRGMCNKAMTGVVILRKRLFPNQIQLPKRWQTYYWSLVRTRSLARQRRHDLKYAF
ncbi:IS1 family transposase [bacterium]|nr:IS1 family transposase [bacterium]